MRHVTLVGLGLAVFYLPGAAGAQPSAAPMPDPCALVTKDDVEKATGQSDVVRFPSKGDKMPTGEPYCTIDGGLYDIVLIVHPRKAATPLSTPKDGEALDGVGASAYLRNTPGAIEVFAVGALSSPYALQVELQSKLSSEDMRPVAVALAQAALERLK